MAKTKTVSYSQYAIYKDCPHKWYLQYCKKQSSFQPSIYLVFGTALHETLQLWLKVMYNQSGKASDEMDLVADFKARFLEDYKKRYQENGNVHFSTKEEMQEFLEDAIAILTWVKKKRKKYFSIRNTELVGIEIPVDIPASESHTHLKFRGSIDFILYHKSVKKYTIYDIKTSTRGWTASDKRDDKKINQVLLYKRTFAKNFNVSEDDIDVLFFIVKRKIFEQAEYPIPRVQEFKPAAGKVKTNKAYNDFQSFLKECFTPNGDYIEKDYYKNVGSACRFCPFNNSPDLCNRENKVG